MLPKFGAGRELTNGTVLVRVSREQPRGLIHTYAEEFIKSADGKIATRAELHPRG